MNKTLFTEEQMNQIEYGKMELLDVSKYANPELTPNQMRLLRFAYHWKFLLMGTTFQKFQKNQSINIWKELL